MSTRKTSLVYSLLILVSGLAVGMVVASRLDLTPQSSAQTITVPPMNSAPVTGAFDAQTFRNVAKAQSPMVVNIRTESRQRTQDLSDFFGGRGGAPADSAPLRLRGGGGGRTRRPAPPLLRPAWRSGRSRQRPRRTAPAAPRAD